MEVAQWIIKKVYEEWLANPYFDEATKEELRAIGETKKKSKNALCGSGVWLLPV